MDTWTRGAWINNEYTAEGKVYLVGGGPGDPDLITVKGLRCLRVADVVLYDRLISEELLDEMRPGATRVFVGKGPAHHALEQAMINELLIAYARQGCMVVRLKGGDPFIFGRGGEEAEALANAGIPFEIVPGVSAAIAVPAYAGIPVTHRDRASAVTIVTGHEGRKQDSQRIDWEALAKLGGTLVVLMGVKALPRFTRQLMDGGLDPALPAAVIQEGTTGQQRVVTGTLADIAQRAQEAGLSSPATTVIGSVVDLHETLAWYAGAVQERYILAAHMLA
jgi:uroporphyrin-III C-methyltransferase